MDIFNYSLTFNFHRSNELTNILRIEKLLGKLCIKEYRKGIKASEYN